MTDIGIAQPAPVPFEKRRFRTAASHYLAGRTPYPDALIARIAQLCGVGRRDRVLDLGCGPGQIGRAFATIAGDVVGVDPEPEMLRIACDLSAGLSNVTWREGSSYELPPDLGAVKLVCMGRAFHWMDRPETLRRLDAIVADGGAIALLSDSHPNLPDNDWRRGYRAVLDRYGESDSAQSRWRAPNWVRHEAILLDSPFPRLEGVKIVERHDVNVETLVSRALSMSSTCPERLGDQLSAMVAELRTTLPGDRPLREVVASTALIARRK